MSKEGDTKTSFHGGDALVMALHAEEVEYVFGVPGGEFLAFLEAMDRWGTPHGMKYINCHHEQGAAHMADGYARSSGKIGVCCGTVGPGLLDLIPGIGPAWADNIPILVIHPQQGPKFADYNRLQGGLDQIGLLKPLTKYQKSESDPNRIIKATQKCFKELTTGRPQPVQLEIMEDAFWAQVEEYGQEVRKPREYRAVYPPQANAQSIKTAVKILSSAKNPLIVAGGGVLSSHAESTLQEFSLGWNIPCITTVMGIGSMSLLHETYIGASFNQSACIKAAQEADVILALGTKFSFTLGYGKAPLWNPEGKVIQVDLDPLMIGKNRLVEIGIIGDIGEVLHQLKSELTKQDISPFDTTSWISQLLAAREEGKNMMKNRMNSDKIPIHPDRVIAEVYKFLNPEDILVVDGGDTAVLTLAQVDYHTSRQPRTYLQSIGSGHLGINIPYMIGAKLAHPDRKVFGITGDGAFLFNVQELNTAVRYNLPFVLVVIDNCSWGMIENVSIRKFGKNRGSYFCDLPSDCAKIAEGFGCYAERVEDPEQLRNSLDRAFNSNKPAVIVVPTKKVAPTGTKLMAGFNELKF